MSTKKEIVTSEAPAPVVAYSQGLIVQDKFVYTSGQIAIDPSTGKLINGSLQDRVNLILQNISTILKKGGSDLTKVFKVNIFLVNPVDFAPMNQVYETFFSKPFPARTCVFVKALPLGTDVEIECSAEI